MKLPSKNKKTHSSLIRFPLSYNYKHSLYNGIFFGHLKLPMLKPLYKKGDRTSVANWVNQSVNHFTHPLCQVFDTGHISKGIVHKFMYGITCLFCPTQWLALCFISGGGGSTHHVGVPDTWCSNEYFQWCCVVPLHKLTLPPETCPFACSVHTGWGTRRCLL